MTYKSIEIDFISDEHGKSCIVPDLNKYFPEDFLKRNEFKFYIIRQLNENGKPNDLYLKDVSSLRTPEQNATSKYKFQSINVSFDGLNQDPYLVRLQPNDKLDLPEYTKNQKEYACFENLTNGKAEIVAVFRKLSNEELNDPELFKVNYTNKNGETKVITPEVTENGQLFYREVQEEMNNLLNSLPETNFKTQYLFCGQFLTAKIDKADYRENVSVVEKTITDSLVECYVSIYLVNNQEIENIGSNMNISKHKGENAYQKIINKVFIGSYSRFSVSEVFLDKECLIPFSNKYNISNKFHNLILYTKNEFVEFYEYNNNLKICNTCGVEIDIPHGGTVFTKQQIEDEFKKHYKMPNGFTSFEIRKKSTQEPLDQLIIKDLFSKNYEIEIHNRITVNFKPLDNASITFDLFKYPIFEYHWNNEKKDIFLAADITSLVSNRNTIASAFGSDNRQKIFSVEQFKENEILLVERIGAKNYQGDNYIDIFKERINECVTPHICSFDAPKTIEGGLDFLIVEENTDIILEKFHSNREIKRMYTGFFYADAAYNSQTLYVTKIDTSELEKRYNISRNINHTAITRAEVAYVGSNYNQVGNRLLLEDFYATNIPNYRPYYDYVCFSGRKFHVPDSIKEAPGQELSFWNYNAIKNYLLCIYVHKK